ncbi:MAG: YdeI/OmpD-associated family protein [Flavobacteriaceae bacterium]|nr:YdeI/OmpD-associated family protein [Flavobacteriaceae bacterium]
MTAIKGYIKIKGIVNKFPFKKHLVPVKFGLYRLFVNVPTLKGANTSVGKIADFEIEQDFEVVIKEYPVPKILTEQLRKRKLFDDFNNLSKSKKKVILKYLSFIKTEKTLQKNIEKLIIQLENKERNPRVP